MCHFIPGQHTLNGDTVFTPAMVVLPTHIRTFGARRFANAAYRAQRQLFARSERVKGIDFHPVEPWILTTLYSGMLGSVKLGLGRMLTDFR
jgi:hypothetical protein